MQVCSKKEHKRNLKDPLSEMVLNVETQVKHFGNLSHIYLFLNTFRNFLFIGATLRFFDEATGFLPYLFARQAITRHKEFELPTLRTVVTAYDTLTIDNKDRVTHRNDLRRTLA